MGGKEKHLSVERTKTRLCMLRSKARNAESGEVVEQWQIEAQQRFTLGRKKGVAKISLRRG